MPSDRRESTVEGEDATDPSGSTTADPTAGHPGADDGRDPAGADLFEGFAEGLSADGAWLELSVVADGEAVEAVSEILSRVAPGGTSVEPAFELVDEGLEARIDPTRPAIVCAHLPARDRTAARAAVRRVRDDLGHLQAFGLRPIGNVEVRVVLESDWAEAWKRHLHVMRIGRRIVIRPSWRRHRAAPDDVVIALDPGMAFGTGLHPTTRLCLAGLERWADEGLLGRGTARGEPRPASAGARVLDVGSGSGILSIAAARLGAAEVVALDTDPIAVEATGTNARRNRVARRVRPRGGSLPTSGGPFDLVLANLVASLFVGLALLLRDAVRPGGRLLASGIFVDRERDVSEAFAAVGLHVVERTTEGDWIALDVVRAGSADAAR